MWFDLFMIACGVVVVVGVCGLLVDRYWLVWEWWPLVGWEWRAERHDRLQLEATRREIADVPMPWEWPERITEQWDRTDEEIARCCDDCGADLVDGELHRDGCALGDESWADELHAINQELHSLPSPADGDPGNPPRSLVGGRAGEFGDLSRPMDQLTHYEVEAVIRQLGRADWLPAAA